MKEDPADMAESDNGESFFAGEIAAAGGGLEEGDKEDKLGDRGYSQEGDDGAVVDVLD